MSAGAIPGDAAVDSRARRLGTAALVAAAAAGCLMSVWFGLATLATTLPDVLAAFPAAPYALDGARTLDAAAVISTGGDPYSVAGYYYSPIAALLFLPLTIPGVEAGLWIWFGLKVAILAWWVIDATRGLRTPNRALVALFVATLVFVIDDFLLGNVSIVVGAAIYLAASRDRAWAGIPIGIVLAAFAKPLVLPFLAWLVVYRRGGAVAAVVTALAATAVGVAALGLPAYQSYLEALSAASRLDFSWSIGLAGVAPGLLLPASIVVLVTFGLLLWKSRDESSLLVWSLLVGLIAAPYVGHYSVVPVLAGIPAFARSHPSRALLLTAVAIPVSLVALMAGTVIGLVIAFPTDALARFRMRRAGNVGQAPAPVSRP
jgi:Glycosyltransferase family 87